MDMATMLRGLWSVSRRSGRHSEAGSFLETPAMRYTAATETAAIRTVSDRIPARHQRLEETAEVLAITPVRVKRDWKRAKAWLYGVLTAEQDHTSS